MATGIEQLRLEAAAALLVIGRLLRQAAVVERVGQHYCNSIDLPRDDYAVYDVLPGAPRGYGPGAAAIASLEEALALVPNGVLIRYELAKLWHLTGDHDEAIAHLRDVVAQLPKFTAARFFLGEALLSAGLPKQAADEFRHCLAQRPGLADVQRRLTSIARSAGACDTGADELRALAAYSYPDFRGNEIAPVTLEGQPIEPMEVGPMVLVEEGYRGYNIIECGGLFYALAQSLGPAVPDDARIGIIEARSSSPYRRLCKVMMRYVDKLPYGARRLTADLLGASLGSLASRIRRIAFPVLYAPTREDAIAAIDAHLDQRAK